MEIIGSVFHYNSEMKRPLFRHLQQNERLKQVKGFISFNCPPFDTVDVYEGSRTSDTIPVKTAIVPRNDSGANLCIVQYFGERERMIENLLGNKSKKGTVYALQADKFSDIIISLTQRGYAPMAQNREVKGFKVKGSKDPRAEIILVVRERHSFVATYESSTLDQFLQGYNP